MAKGISIRATTGELVFDAFLQDSFGNLVTSGSTYFRLYRRIEASGTLESFDWNDATFKTTSLTTENLSASHRKGNNNTRDTGLWTARLSSLSNFAKGDICYVIVDNTYSSPKIQMTKFQFGSAEGDMTTNSSGILDVNVDSWRDSIPDILQSGQVHSYTDGGGGGGGTDVNVVSWNGTSVNNLVSGDVPVYVKDYDEGKWPLQPQVERRNVDVTSSGTVGINWGNIENKTANVNLTNTSISGTNTSSSSSSSNVNITGWLGLPPNSLKNGRIDSYVGAYAPNMFPLQSSVSGRYLDVDTVGKVGVTGDFSTLASKSQLDSISGRFNTLSANVSGWLGLVPNSLISGRIDVNVGSYSSGELPLKGIVQNRPIDITSSGTVGINWGNIQNQTANVNLTNTAISGTNTSSSSTSSSNVNITGWLGLPPNSLNNGRIETYVGAYAPGMMPLQSSVSGRYLDVTLTGKVGVTGDFSNISVNVSGWKGLSPNSLISGRIDSYVGEMADNVLGSGALAATAVTEINSGMPTLSDLLSLSGKFDNLSVNISGWRGLQPNVLNNGRVESYVGGYAPNMFPLQPSVTGRYLDVTTVGKIGATGDFPTYATNNDIMSLSGRFNVLSTNVSGWIGIAPNSLVGGRVDAYTSLIKDDLITSGTLHTSAITKIQTGLSTNSDILSISGKFTNLSVNISGWRGLSPNTLVNGRIESYVGAYAPNQAPLQPSVTGRYIDVTGSGTVGINWGNIENKNYTALLTNTSISGVDNSASSSSISGYATHEDILNISGLLNNLSVNVSGWKGESPDNLASGMVHSYIDSTSNGDVNVITWAGVNVSPLVSGLLPVIVNDYDAGKWPLQPIAERQNIYVSNSGYVGVIENLDKTGYSLSPSGLDFISITHPTGVASNFREMSIQLWRRFFKKTTLSAASGILTFDNNGTTIITRQSVSDDGTTQVQGSS